MSKVVKIKTQNESGEPLAGERVKVSGCGELVSNLEGLTQYLVDEDPVSIEIGGAEAWSGPIADLGSLEVFVRTGAGFKRQ